MVIFFLTTQEELCGQVAARLHERFSYTVRVFADIRAFYEAAATVGRTGLDLIACDYLAYEADEINPYDIMEEQDCVIPFFYYNYPYARRYGHLSECWYQKMKAHQGARLGVDALFRLLPVLVRVEDELMAADILPYMALLNGIMGTEKPSPTLLESFRRLHNVQRSRFEVFSYLFAHKNEEISERELCLYVWHEYTPQRLRALYTYISDLRRMCREEKDGRLSIARAGKKCYCLTVL